MPSLVYGLSLYLDVSTNANSPIILLLVQSISHIYFLFSEIFSCVLYCCHVNNIMIIMMSVTIITISIDSIIGKQNTFFTKAQGKVRSERSAD